MIFKGIEKKEEGKFIHRYNLKYETVSGNEKVYEIISRNKNLETFDDLHNKPADAVVIIVNNEAGDKILINKEYRMAAGDWVYNFPAGLIDPGENPQAAAKLELKEETGLDLIEITDFIGESYSAIGFANEKNVCVVGVAAGTFAPSTSDVEEIECGWYSKAEIRELLKTEKFAARTQAYVYLWSKE